MRLSADKAVVPVVQTALRLSKADFLEHDVVLCLKCPPLVFSRSRIYSIYVYIVPYDDKRSFACLRVCVRLRVYANCAWGG